MKTTESLTIVLGSLLAVAIIACILAWPVQLLWNGCLVSAVNGVNEIGFFQALGLNILFSILIKPSTKMPSKND